MNWIQKENKRLEEIRNKKKENGLSTKTIRINQTRYQNGNNAIESGQLRAAGVMGGIVTGNQHYENGTGLFGMSEKKKKKAQSNGGKEVSSRPEWKKTAVKGGKISAKSPKHPNNTLIKCIHCGMNATLPLISRWHNDNCKLKKQRK